MTTTVLGIYNAAISAAHGKGRLTSLSDVSREKSECDIWYDQVRTQILEAAYWPPARRTSRLTLKSTRDQTLDWVPGDPETQFLYKYSLPTNCIRPWYLVNYEQFIVSFDPVDGINVLNTNVEDATLVFAADQTNPAFWSPGLRASVIYALAATISGAIKGDQALKQTNFTLANDQIMQARMNVAGLWNEQQETLPPPLAARGHTIAEETRFYYPYGDMFASAVPNA